MKANTIRSFASGLLVATVVCGAVYFLTPGEATSTKKKEDLSTEEMKSALSSENYIVLTEVELAEKLAAAQMEAEANQEQTAAEDGAEEKVVYRTIISVTSGMTSIDVGDALVNAHIIDSRKSFVDLVEQKGLVQELRPGSFEVQSDMTIDQVIATIYKQ